MKSEKPNSEFRLLHDCYNLYYMILKITEDNHRFRYTTNQHILRTVVSVGSNIAEGNAFKGKQRQIFFNIAKGSIEELKFQIGLYSLDVEFHDRLIDLIDKISAILYKLGVRSSENRSSEVGS